MHSLPSIVLVLLILRLSSSNLTDFYLRVLRFFYFLFFSYLMHPPPAQTDPARLHDSGLCPDGFFKT